MALVDIVHEDQRIPMGPHLRVRDFASGIPADSRAARGNLCGIRHAALDAPASRRWGKIAPPYNRRFEREQQLHLWAESLPALDDAETSQKDWSSESMALFHGNPQDGILGNLPLVVLTRGQDSYSNAEIEAERKRLQAQLARLSKRGTQVILPSGHNMHLENPDAVVNAIRSVVGRRP
jgi:pimeloyl-ACP methyl ester carboxylesterase